jgi:hypothetical protein
MPERQQAPPLVGFDPRSIFQGVTGFRAGQADLVVGGESRQVLGRMAACYFGYREEEGRIFFQGVSVIAPPKLVWDYSDEDIHALLLKGLEDVQGGPLPAQAANAFLEHVTVQRCTQLDSNEVIAAVRTVGGRRVIVVPHSSKYREPALKPDWALGRSGALLAEDMWVPHVVHLAQACCEAAQTGTSVIVFHADEDAPAKQESRQALTDVDLLYPIFLEHAGQANMADLMSRQIPRWVALAAGGRTQVALEELEKAELAADVKRQVALQVVARAGDGRKTLELLHERLAEFEMLPADAAARFGQMAYKFGDKELARRLFAACVDDLNDEMWLETSLMTATSIAEAALVERCWNRLSSLFKNSVVLQENRDFRLMLICDASANPSLAATSKAGFEEFHVFISDALSPEEKPNYGALVESVRARWAESLPLAAVCIALHALGRGDLPSAVVFAELALEDGVYEAQAARTLLGALQRMFLLQVRTSAGMDEYKLPLLHIMRYLGGHPSEAGLRARVASALSVESAGAIGLPLLASFAIDVVARGANLKDAARLPEAASEEELKNFIVRAYGWMTGQGAIEPGVTRMPAEVVGGNAASLIAALERMMRYAARNQDAPEDLKALQDWAYMVCLLHPHAPEFSADLDALRLLAVKLSVHGQPQRARDIAEQILILGSDSAERQRLAWGNYADVYQHTRSPVDALIGVTCAALTNAPLGAADLYQEAYTLLRVSRDLHMYGFARAILPACRRLIGIQGLGEMGLQRLAGVEIALDVAESSEIDVPGRVALLGRARVHCEDVMQGGDELFPAAAQFLQVAGALERDGHELPQAAATVRAVLYQRLGLETATFLKALSAAHPTAEEVVWLHNRLGAASNSEDTAGDQLSVVLSAHRLLQHRTPEISPEQAAVAAELLSDRSLGLETAARPLTVAWPCQFIANLSKSGLGVLMVATDNNGEVVAAVAEHGDVRIERPAVKGHTFASLLSAWSATYPYRYGFIEREEGNGEFYSSMRDIELPMPNTDRVLIIAEPMLQQIAFNVVLADGRLVGESKAIGLAPSLTWFEDVRRRPRTPSHIRYAWISCSPESEAFGTLDMLFARLGPVFDHHGFTTDTSGRIPDNVRGASIAIATAHGQLTTEQRYIHRIADEHDLTESPVALARALAGVELVILFVCSGGRVDRHPIANTTVSLPKMLLDRGCRAVVASPWPLAAAVPGNWLERFLEAWEGGDTVLQASFKANQRVAERLGQEPALSLAMAAYGDVLLTK